MTEIIDSGNEIECKTIWSEWKNKITALKFIR